MSPARSAILAAVLFAAIAIPLSAVRPLWLDEILRLIETRRPSTIAMLDSLRQTPGAVPLGYIVQRAVVRIGGYSRVVERLQAVLFGAGAVFIVALLGTELGLRRGWQAAVIFAVFPMTLRYATESGVYSQALFFSVLATLLHVRLAHALLAKRPAVALAGPYCLAVTAAVYTQPYSLSVGLAHLLWSCIRRAGREALLSGSALALAVIAFLPWFWWSRRGWHSGVEISAFHFSVSAKTPLMLFRELSGAGYWGSGLLLILCAVALRAKPLGRGVRILLLLLIATVIGGALAGDAWFDYFIAARQFLWLLPAVAILAAAGLEASPRAGIVIAALLMIVCVRQSAVFFAAPGEDWQKAADVLADKVGKGDCLAVAPPEQASLYAFFHPELRNGRCRTSRIMLAITPAATSTVSAAAFSTLIAAHYYKENEETVGRSRIVYFHRIP
jgi:4-amino-4-deoxy-L-arabinose transferase-like glycosyltransferase